MATFSNRPRSTTHCAALAGLWLVLGCACGRQDGHATAGSEPVLPVAGLVAESVSVSGRVVLLGGPPKLLGRVLDLTGIPCAPQTALVHPAWKMDAEGGLAEVVITVSGSTRASNVAAKPSQVELSGCVFHPYVTALQAGETLSVHNSETSAARLSLQHHAADTLDQGEMMQTHETAPGQAWACAMAQPGTYRLVGEAHPWQQAWIVVHEGIHKAVSGPDGRYAVARALPDGEYVVQAWHPRFKKKLSKTVQVVNGAAQVDFAFDYSHSFDASQMLDS